MKMNLKIKSAWAILVLLASGGCKNLPLNSTSLPGINKVDSVSQPAPYPGPVHKLTTRSDIREVQRLLGEQGYDPGPIDGSVGPKTRTAIKSFQSAHSLPVDELASDKLLGFLRQSSEPKPIRTHSSESNTTDIAALSHSNSNFTSQTTKEIANNCVHSSNKDVEALKTEVFNSIIDQLQIDVGPYLQGFCAPQNLQSVSLLYTYMITEGVLHTRIAGTKYNELLSVYEKAGVDMSVQKDALRKSTDAIRKSTDELPGDLRNYAQKKDLKEAPELIENGFVPDDNAEFQKELIAAYDQIDSSSPFKKQAAYLLSDVLSHSTQSTFYLTRSAFVFDKLKSFLETNEVSLSDKISLGWFMFNSLDDVYSILISSTYGIRALTADAEGIPPIDPAKATKEARELKIQAGISADELDNDQMFKENSYDNFDKNHGNPNHS